MKSPFIIGLPDSQLSETDKIRLERMRPQGIILFARNYKSTEGIKQLIQETKDILGDDIIMCVDHEGGRVVRFPEALPKFPAPRLMAEAKDPKQVKEYAQKAGDALADWGFNWNLAPVVDTRTSTTHPLMIDRCFGSDPEFVAEMSVAFIEGMHAAGIKCTAKHFPCVGPAKDDTHDKGTAVDLSREELDRLWIPFRAAIDAGVDAVMISHAVYTNIDPELPATLSPKVITDVLRNELGFQKTVISDDLEMGAIAEAYPIETATKMCLDAGCDLACICLEVENQEKAWEVNFKKS